MDRDDRIELHKRRFAVMVRLLIRGLQVSTIIDFCLNDKQVWLTPSARIILASMLKSVASDTLLMQLRTGVRNICLT